MHIESVFSQLYLPNNSLKRYFIFQEAIITKVKVHCWNYCIAWKISLPFMGIYFPTDSYYGKNISIWGNIFSNRRTLNMETIIPIKEVHNISNLLPMENITSIYGNIFSNRLLIWKKYFHLRKYIFHIKSLLENILP